MATMATLLADLNDRLDDAGNSISEATKINWINHGVNAMWPRLYVVAEGSILLAEDTYSYDLPAPIDDDAFIFEVKVEYDVSDGRYVGFQGQYKLPKDILSRTIEVNNPDPFAGQYVRLRAVQRIPTMATTGATYEGPPGTEELPVLYAMGIASSRRLFTRLDYTRYSTTTAKNGVDVNEVMNSQQFWFAQFELLCDRFAMPWPVSTEE